MYLSKTDQTVKCSGFTREHGVQLCVCCVSTIESRHLGHTVAPNEPIALMLVIHPSASWYVLRRVFSVADANSLMGVFVLEIPGCCNFVTQTSDVSLTQVCNSQSCDQPVHRLVMQL